MPSAGPTMAPIERAMKTASPATPASPVGTPYGSPGSPKPKTATAGTAVPAATAMPARVADHRNPSISTSTASIGIAARRALM